MINKILCFMWGHQFIEYIWITPYHSRHIKRLTELDGTKITFCKHCGKTK